VAVYNEELGRSDMAFNLIKRFERIRKSALIKIMGPMGFFSKANLQDGLRKIKKIVTYTCGVDASLTAMT